MIFGNAYETVGYESDGEANDWILDELGIISCSPELGNGDIFSYDFSLEFQYVTVDILKETIPWIMYTFKKVGA